MAGKKKTAKKTSKKTSPAPEPESSDEPPNEAGDDSGKAPPPTADGTSPPTAASEILDAMNEIKARREAARQAFVEQREMIRKTLEEQRQSAMDFLADFRRTLQTEEQNMVHIATEQAKAALEALLPPSVRATTEAAQQPPAPAAAPEPAPADDSAKPDPVLDADQKILTALKLVIMNAADTKKLSQEDADLAEQVLLDSLKELAKKQAPAVPQSS